MFHFRSVKTLTLVLAFAMGWFSASVGAAVEEDEVLCQPQHVHLSLGEAEDQMAVVWATNSTCDTQVEYDTSPWLTHPPDTGPRVTGREQQYTEHNAHGLHVVHKAMMTGLQGSKTYYYRPTSSNIGTGPFYFQAPAHGTAWSPELLVVSDLGPHLEMLPLLTEETLSGQFTAVLQLGGLSSFLSDSNGTKGDSLMKGLEHMAAFVPVMTTPGESEMPNGQFPGYRYRFSMPGSQWPMREDKLWYSFNLGPVHFISLCTDVYLRGNKTQQTQQYNWLVKDLSQANTDREKRPWIVAFGYHPLYCTSGGNNGDEHDCAKTDSLVRKGLEDTLYYYGVDLVLLSHPGASYERFYPLFKGVVLSTNFTNPRAPVQILTGAASTPTPTASAAAATTTTTTTQKPVAPKPVPTNQTSATAGDGASPSASMTENSGSSSGKSSDSGDGTTKKDNAEVKNSDSAKDASGQNLTAFKFVDGAEPTYGRLHIINSTHAHWELLAGRSGKTGSEKKERKVLDSLMLVQEHHDKFQLSELPDDVEKKIDENLVAGGGEPGVLNVHDPVLETKKMLAADDSRRLIIGASFGALILVIIVIAVAIKVRGRTRRRSVRRWDVMDYKYGKTKLYAPTNDEEDEDDDFQGDHDFEMDIPDGTMQTKKLINGK